VGSEVASHSLVCVDGQSCGLTSAVQARAGSPFCGVLDALGPPCLTANVRRQPALPITKTESRTMAALGGLFFVVYVACVIAVVIYVLRLLGRFVSAHERVASSLDIIARKMRDDAKP
jgi:uncharacterized membrane protein